MEWQSGHTGYFDSFSHRNWVTWLASCLVALGLNLVLFLLMPCLMDKAPSRPSIETLVPMINVVRVKRQETEVKRKPVKQPEPPKVRPDSSRPETAPRQPLKAKLTLPFEINPRLPGGPNSLDLPPLESGPLVKVTDRPGAFSVGQLDAPLTVLARIPPVYPMRARRRGIEGWVKITFVVDETGIVENITIIEAQPPGLFDQSVQRCVGSWRFRPGTVEGLPVKTKVETTIRFELE